VYAVIENTPGDILVVNSGLSGEITERVNLHFAVRNGNHLCLHQRLGCYALLLRIPNDEGSKDIDDDSRGGLACVCFSPKVCIGVTQD